MSKQHLVLVDADPRTLHLVEASLRAAGFAVTAAANGEAALALCRTKRPDVVVTDTSLPGMDGFQLCAAIRAEERLGDVPVVFVSGRASVDEQVRARELGADAPLTKPIDARQLVQRARALVAATRRGRLPPPEAVLQVDYLLLSERLADIPDELEALLRRVDGRRTLGELVAGFDGDELDAVNAMGTLIREELVRRCAALPPALPRPPRVVRFGSPVIVAPARSTGDAAPPASSPQRPDGPSASGDSAVDVTPPAAVLRDARPGRKGVRLAALALVVTLLAGAVTAWALSSRERRRIPAPVASVPPADPDAYQAALADARRDHAVGRYSDAASRYQQAIAVRVTAEAYEGLGRALREAGDVAAGIEAVRRAIDLDPASGAAYIALARMFLDEQRVDEARSAYERYLAIEPRGSHADEAQAALAAAR